MTLVRCDGCMVVHIVVATALTDTNAVVDWVTGCGKRMKNNRRGRMHATLLEAHEGEPNCITCLANGGTSATSAT